jgi:hypothetical protein
MAEGFAPYLKWSFICGPAGTWMTPEVLVYIQTIIAHAQMLLSTATSMPSSGASVGVLGKSLKLL